jgi:prepilin-type N-terminal cleavage/methylation domain-containing protein
MMNGSARQTRGFTLVEIMIVIGILAILVTLSGPAILSVLDKDSMRAAANNVLEACTQARAQAILHGVTAELVIRPRSGEFHVQGVAPAPARGGEEERLAAPTVAPDPAFGQPAPAAAFTARLYERISIELLDVNFVEMKDAEEARVRFHANGTCDEFSIVLRSEKNEWRKISLEVATGLADIESDPNRFLR